MRRQLFLILAIFGAIFGAALHAAADPVEWIEGASQREREIRWFWKYLGEFTESCAQSSTDCQDAEVRELLPRLLELLPAEPQASSTASGQQLDFRSETEEPTLFQSSEEETHRLATTGLAKGAKVFINVDRMHSPDRLQWIGILAHEAVHHLGIKDDSRRLPDRVGAAIAEHVRKNWNGSFMGEFGHPNDGVLSFSDPSGRKPARILLHAVGFAIDEDAIPSPRVPICKPGEKFLGQTVSATLWRALHIRGDKRLVKLRGSAPVESICQDAAGKSWRVRTNFAFMIDLRFAEIFDPQSAWWELPSAIDVSSLAAGNSDYQNETLDLNRAYIIKKMVNSKASYGPGDVWESQIDIESIEGHVPELCTGFFTASKWHFNRLVSTALFDGFQDCKLTSLGGNQYRVDLKFQFPSNAQPDLFSLSFLHFRDSGIDRFAFPSRPQFVRFENAQALPPPIVSAWRVIGLSPRPTLQNVPLTNSYRVEYDQPFWLEIDVKGTQTYKRQFLDFDYIGQTAAGQVLVPSDIEVTDLEDTVLATEQVAIPGGTRLRYKMVMPRTVAKVPALGFKIRGISLETDDFSWTEFEIPNFLEAMFLTDLLQ